MSGGIRAQPVPFIAFSGSISSRTPTGNSTDATLTAFRYEVGLKLLRPWVSGGLISADRGNGLAPIVYDTLLLPTSPGRISGYTTAIRGPLFRGLGIDAWAVHWSSASRYQPEWQSRSEINYSNNFLKHFRRGDFEVKAAGVYEYRSATAFPFSDGDVPSLAAKTLSALLEIRIMRAVITYQQRNILGYQYDIVPGFEMPRVLAIYGVRWDFWN
ncbi:MAG: hypothetical protein AUG20_02740 [Gemmatimonas sp. 13_1_20CM_3_60_15]|nr:MAG: hypothetical protein AUG20_02740 [Gemmatimonas sp. 13_1_20CM_3_60_15]